MMHIVDYPVIMGVLVFLFLRGGTQLILKFLRDRGPGDLEAKDGINLIVTAVLTLLGLLIGFTFSMATSRYDQRKTMEEAEANAIGTEYVRADLMPVANAIAVRQLLKDYTAERILYYNPHTAGELQQIAARRAQLQQQLWAAVLPVVAAEPRPVTNLVLSGMNDVLNSQGYTHAAWLNRIPVEAWVLLLLVALLANGMILYSARSMQKGGWQLLILPLLVAVSVWMIADIDSPRGGLIKVSAPNLRIVLADMQ
jgi:hypothetical protein